MIEHYRVADSDTKKAAVQVLKGENADLVSTLLSAASNLTSEANKSYSTSSAIANLIGDAIEGPLGGK